MNGTMESHFNSEMPRAARRYLDPEIAKSLESSRQRRALGQHSELPSRIALTAPKREIDPLASHLQARTGNRLSSLPYNSEQPVSVLASAKSMGLNDAPDVGSSPQHKLLKAANWLAGACANVLLFIKPEKVHIERTEPPSLFKALTNSSARRLDTLSGPGTSGLTATSVERPR